MKKIYLLLTYTGTPLAKIIKIYTRCKYSHVSIALDKNLDELYSFGRINAYNPFLGGFVHEGIHFGTFKRFKKTLSEVYSLEISDEKYDKLKSLIKTMEKNKSIYKFNKIGLFLSAFNINYNPNNKFYCAEFVKFVLDETNTIINLPNPIKPQHFRNLDNTKLIYRGLLQNYSFK